MRSTEVCSSESALTVDTVTVRNAVRKLRVSCVGLLWTRRSVYRLFSTSCLSSVLPYFPPTQSSSCKRFELFDKGQRRFSGNPAEGWSLESRRPHDLWDFFPLSVYRMYSRGSVVTMATELRAGRSGVLIPVRTRDVSLLQIVQTSSRAHPASSLVFSDTGVFCYPRIKLSGLEVNYIQPTDEVKNA